MKNLFNATLFILLSSTLFSCNKTEEPQPQNDPKMATMAGFRTGAEVQDNGSARVRQTPGYFWKPVKSTSLKLNNSLTLKSPFDQAPFPAGDFSWGTDGGCYSALKPKNVTFYNLGIVNVNDVSLEYLKTLTFNQYQISAAPVGSQSWTNYLPVKTIIACKTAAGKYFLLEVKQVVMFSAIDLDIYQGLYLL